MRLAAAFAWLLALTAPTYAHQAPEASTWSTSVSGNVSFTQAGFYRWHDGGTSSLALSAGVTGKASQSAERWRQDHKVHLSFGLVTQEGQGLRKAEDEMRVSLSFSNPERALFGILEPSLGVDFRSQFAAGFDYSKEGSPQISGPWAPAILLESIGVRADPSESISVELGAAAKQTFVQDPELRARYKVQQDRMLRSEVGVSSRTQVKVDVAPNVHLSSDIQLFSSFSQRTWPDLNWETEVAMTVNRWLQVNLEYVAKLDRDVSRSLQMREVLALGVSFALL